MAELKPRLIMTRPGRKRRGFGTFITVLIIFALGFYAGYKYGDYIFGAGPQKVNTQSQEPGTNLKELAVSTQHKEPGSENEDIIYSEGTHATTSDQMSFDDGEYPEEVLGDTGSYVDTDPDQMLFVSETANTNQEMEEPGLENSVKAQSGNETDTATDEASTSVSTYTLQVGAFSTPEEAQSVVDRYKSKGYEAYHVPIENSLGVRWNLVKIGKFNTIDQAWSYASYFNNREGVEAYVESVEQGTLFNESGGQREISEQQ